MFDFLDKINPQWIYGLAMVIAASYFAQKSMPNSTRAKINVSQNLKDSYIKKEGKEHYIVYSKEMLSEDEIKFWTQYLKSKNRVMEFKVGESEENSVLYARATDKLEIFKA